MPSSIVYVPFSAALSSLYDGKTLIVVPFTSITTLSSVTVVLGVSTTVSSAVVESPSSVLFEHPKNVRDRLKAKAIENILFIPM